MSDIDTLFPEPIRIRVAGEDLEIAELTVAQLPRFLRAIGPLAGAIGGSGGAMDLQAILAGVAQHVEALPELVAIVTGRDRDWVNGLRASDLVRLAEAVIEANADFFGQVARSLQSAAPRLAQATAGVTPSRGSSRAATG
jgi:hypothetical protein